MCITFTHFKNWNQIHFALRSYPLKLVIFWGALFPLLGHTWFWKSVLPRILPSLYSLLSVLRYPLTYPCSPFQSHHLVLLLCASTFRDFLTVSRPQQSQFNLKHSWASHIHGPSTQRAFLGERKWGPNFHYFCIPTLHILVSQLSLKSDHFKVFFPNL